MQSQTPRYKMSAQERKWKTHDKAYAGRYGRMTEEAGIRVEGLISLSLWRAWLATVLRGRWPVTEADRRTCDRREAHSWLIALHSLTDSLLCSSPRDELLRAHWRAASRAWKLQDLHRGCSGQSVKPAWSLTREEAWKLEPHSTKVLASFTCCQHGLEATVTRSNQKLKMKLKMLMPELERQRNFIFLHSEEERERGRERKAEEERQKQKERKRSGIVGKKLY